MPRNVPDELKTLLASGRAIEHSTVTVITEDGDIFRWSTIDAQIMAEPYEARIKSVGALKQSLGRAIDNVEVAIENLASDYGADFVVLQNKLDGATVKIGRWFVHPDTGEEWHVFVMQGVAASVQFSQDEFKLTVIADLAARGQLGARCTTRTCQWEYKGAECGYAGEMPSCSKIYDDVNGCTGHSNEARFGGFPKAQNADTVNTASYGTVATTNANPQGWTQDAWSVATDYGL
jgi:Uncharacterized conserved protein (DUF2163)